MDPLSLGIAATLVSGAAVAGPNLANTSRNRSARTLSLPQKLKNGLAATAFPSQKPKTLTTLESAKELMGVVEQAKSALSRIKIGHLLGGAWLATSPLPWVLKKFGGGEESSIYNLTLLNLPFAIVGGLGMFATATFAKNDFEGSGTSIVDDYVQRYTVRKDGSSIKHKSYEVSQDIENTRTFPSLKDVILPGDEVLAGKNQTVGARAKVTNGITRSQIQGEMYNFRGAVGCGKTMTANALAREVLNQQWYTKDTVQVWNVSSSITDKTIFDSDGGAMIVNMFGMLGINIQGETVTQRFERLLAHAKKHYLETGEYVVVVINEAHNVLGMDSNSSNTADPKAVSKSAYDLGTFIEDKLSTDLGQGVIAVFTSNAAAKQMSAALGRRVNDVEFYRKGAGEAALLIKSVVNAEICNNKHLNQQLYSDRGNLVLADEVFQELGKIGIRDILKDEFGGGTNDQENEERVRKEVQAAGGAGFMEKLRALPVLSGDDITKAVNDACLNYQSGGSIAFKELISQNLEFSAKTAVSKRAVIFNELKQFYGDGGNVSNNSDFSKSG